MDEIRHRLESDDVRFRRWPQGRTAGSGGFSAGSSRIHALRAQGSGLGQRKRSVHFVIQHVSKATTLAGIILVHKQEKKHR